MPFLLFNFARKFECYGNRKRKGGRRQTLRREQRHHVAAGNVRNPLPAVFIQPASALGKGETGAGVERTDSWRELIHVGANATVLSPFHCDYGYNIEIGDNFFSNVNLVILDGAKVKIGNNVFIAPNVGIYTAGHPLDVEQRNSGLEYAYPITIGNNVWIGAGVSILPGVTIGDNTVVGAGSVVNRSLPSGVLAVGNPCRVIRKITEQE